MALARVCDFANYHDETRAAVFVVQTANGTPKDACMDCLSDAVREISERTQGTVNVTLLHYAPKVQVPEPGLPDAKA